MLLGYVTIMEFSRGAKLLRRLGLEPPIGHGVEIQPSPKSLPNRMPFQLVPLEEACLSSPGQSKIPVSCLLPRQRPRPEPRPIPEAEESDSEMGSDDLPLSKLIDDIPLSRFIKPKQGVVVEDKNNNECLKDMTNKPSQNNSKKRISTRKATVKPNVSVAAPKDPVKLKAKPKIPVKPKVMLAARKAKPKSEENQRPVSKGADPSKAKTAVKDSSTSKANLKLPAKDSAHPKAKLKTAARNSDATKTSCTSQSQVPLSVVNVNVIIPRKQKSATIIHSETLNTEENSVISVFKEKGSIDIIQPQQPRNISVLLGENLNQVATEAGKKSKITKVLFPPTSKDENQPEIIDDLGVRVLDLSVCSALGNPLDFSTSTALPVCIDTFYVEVQSENNEIPNLHLPLDLSNISLPDDSPLEKRNFPTSTAQKPDCVPSLTSIISTSTAKKQAQPTKEKKVTTVTATLSTLTALSPQAMRVSTLQHSADLDSNEMLLAPVTYALSDEDADDFSPESDVEDWAEWNAAEPLTERCRQLSESESDGSVDENIHLTLPKNRLKNRWVKTLNTKTGKKKKNNQHKENPSQVEGNSEAEDLCLPVWICADISEVDRTPVLIPPPSPELKNPFDYFTYFFDTDLMETAVQHTNTYSVWKTNGQKSIDLTVAEFKKFLGIWLLMGVNQLPALRDFWAWAADTYVPQVSSCMTFNRFQSIRSSLHFYDKSREHLLDPQDRFAKVRYLLDHMKSKCNDLDQEAHYSVDEAMVPYKGKFAGSLRQYIMSKPHQFGIKIFHLAGSSGIIYDFIPYAGASTFHNVSFSETEEELGLGAKIVLHLSKSIHRPISKLVDYLRRKLNLLSTGTIRSNRLDGCELQPDKEMKKDGRGTYDYKSIDGIQITKWMDSKIVHVVSSLAGVHPLGEAQRYDKTAKCSVSVPCPRVIQLYNSKMGGVDHNDMLVELHRSPTRSRRWYMCLVGYFMDVAVVKSWLIYKRHAKSLGISKLPFKNSKLFRLSIIKSLIGAPLTTSPPGPRVKSVIQRPRGYTPDHDVRYDGENHWPSYTPGQACCKLCKTGYSTVICAKCNVNLCFRPTRQCFNKFHVKDLE
ncbi:PiggyBac transposable element-derived protein 3 [Frankliniella fusca]|uniref:PiggyBac transposable element-derived protein 3 n=1 Tax=Frankliniella fusca TaxID=407009 RepID=A0AAE1HLL2_9NEOP|nr:PiggyBac transposable element-derived protein 3 [Frankliniella fusca]